VIFPRLGAVFLPASFIQSDRITAGQNRALGSASVREVLAAERRQETWEAVFPNLVERARTDRWFDYAAEDAFVAAR